MSKFFDRGESSSDSESEHVPCNLASVEKCQFLRPCPATSSLPGAMDRYGNFECLRDHTKDAKKRIVVSEKSKRIDEINALIEQLKKSKNIKDVVKSHQCKLLLN